MFADKREENNIECSRVCMHAKWHVLEWLLIVIVCFGSLLVIK